MNIFQRVTSAITNKSAESVNTTQAGSIMSQAPAYRRDYFDNIFDNAVTLAKGFAKIEPYLVNNRGTRVNAQSDIIDSIYDPLEGISAYQLRKTLAIMTVTHDEYFVLIHTSSKSFMSKPTAKNITGFEIIQDTAVAKYGDTYGISTANGTLSVSKDRLMRMTDILDPYDLSRGYAPMRAVRKWARLDDFIIEYQSGLFLNGAVPQGIFDIVASKQDYDVIVGQIKRTMSHNSASGVLFNHIPVSSAGVAQQPTITWRPMASTNKEMATGELLTNNTKKIDGYFGVPQEIRGFLQNSNYASVRIAEYVMVEYGIRDLAMAIWSKFTSELNRCTGGFGAAISFDLETPIIADEEKARAETDTINLDNIFGMVARGYTVKQAVAVLGLPQRYNALGEPTTTDDPNAQGSGEAEETPEAATKSKKALAAKAAVPTFKQPTVDLSDWRARLEEAATASQTAQVDAAIAGIDKEKAAYTDDDGSIVNIPDGEYYRTEDTALESALILILATSLVISGRNDTDSANGFLKAAGIDATLAQFTAGDKKFARLATDYATRPSSERAEAVIVQFKASNSSFITTYRNQLSEVARSYNSETAAQIRSILGNAITNKTPYSKLLSDLKATVTDDWRAKRLANSETHRARNLATQHTINRLEDLTGRAIEKSAIHSGSDNPCPFCEYQIGTWIPARDVFVQKGGTMIGTDGKERINDFVEIGDAHFHPNCHCELVARFV